MYECGTSGMWHESFIYVVCGTSGMWHESFIYVVCGTSGMWHESFIYVVCGTSGMWHESFIYCRCLKQWYQKESDINVRQNVDPIYTGRKVVSVSYFILNKTLYARRKVLATFR